MARSHVDPGAAVDVVERDATPRDVERLDAVRRSLPSILHRHYFNAGRHGPIPVSVAEAVRAEAQVELEQGRGSSARRRVDRDVSAVRSRVEALLNAPAGSVALTHNATEGINLAVNSRRWAPGDEILTLTTEHPSAHAPLDVLARRNDVVVRRIDPAVSPDALLEQVAAALTDRTRMVSLSHVSWATGALVPLRRIADMCHAAGALLVGDGAQSAGVVPVDVVALDVDFYAIPGQKWLLGPSGTGALYVRPELIDEALPTVAGWASIEELDTVTGDCEWLADARRFEGSSESIPNIVGLGESLRWLAEDVGWDWAYRRIRDGARRGREMLAEIDGLELLTPPGDQAGLLCFAIPGLSPDSIVFSLARQKVIVRSVTYPPCVRVCVGFYNNDDDLMALRQALEKVARRATSATTG